MNTILINCALLFAILQISIACECGLSGTVSKIYKGTPVEPHKYPWIAQIRIFSSRTFGHYAQCDGSLIDNQHVVTAAHCVVQSLGVPFQPYSFDVYLGLDKSPRGYEDAYPKSVKNVWFDPKFDPENLSHDLAILTLTSPVNFTSSVYPICLPNSEENLSKLIVAGWGTTHENGETSPILNEVEVDFLTKDECRDIKKKYYSEDAGIPSFLAPFLPVPPITDTIMCAVNKKTKADSCAGDSGGPLMHKGAANRYYLMGSVSGSWAECGTTQNAAGLYTRSYLYKETISKLAPNACWKDLSA